VNRLIDEQSGNIRGELQGDPTEYEDEINLRKLVEQLWEGRWWIGGFTITSLVVAVVIAISLPNIYRAEALLAPVQDAGPGGLSNLASQYSGLASLAGLNLGKKPFDKTMLGIEVLKSRKFVAEFIERYDLLVPLIAAKKMDSRTGELVIDPDIYNTEKGEWTRTVGAPRKATPSLQEAYDEFVQLMAVREDRDSGFVTVSIEHYSPTVAKQWVDWLVADINQTIMEQDVSEAQQTIEYLTKQIAMTSMADLQSIFYRLIEEQTKTVMLANVASEYLFRTVDPAIAPEMKVRPQRALIVLLGGFLGGLLGIFVFTLLRYFRPKGMN